MIRALLTLVALTAAARATAMPAPTFDLVERSVFKGCTTSSCHGAPGKAGDLELTFDRGYAQLVGVPPTNEAAHAAGLLRVAPGDPDRSFLLAKLTGRLGAEQGDPMPQVGRRLSPNKLKLVRRWIAGGAIDAAAQPGRGTHRPIVIRATARPVPLQTEETTCHQVAFPREESTDVNRVDITFRGGSHHVHLYRSYNGEVEYPDKVCNAAVKFDKWQLVTASQTNRLHWQLPPGVAINFSPGQALLVQTHFVNVGDLGTDGIPSAKVVLHPVDPSTVTAHAGALFAQDRTLAVPPGESTWTSRCMLTGSGPNARELTVMAFTGHYHYRGVEFEAYRVQADGALGERVYRHTGYEEPPFVQYPPAKPLVLRPGEGIEWRCTYRNDTGQTLEFGPYTETNEHCNLFGFYYPTATPQEAIDCVHRFDAAGNDVNEVILAR